MMEEAREAYMKALLALPLRLGLSTGLTQVEQQRTAVHTNDAYGNWNLVAARPHRPFGSVVLNEASLAPNLDPNPSCSPKPISIHR